MILDVPRVCNTGYYLALTLSSINYTQIALEKIEKTRYSIITNKNRCSYSKKGDTQMALTSVTSKPSAAFGRSKEVISIWPRMFTRVTADETHTIYARCVLRKRGIQ